MERFIAWFDCHYGWEKRRKGGKLVTAPTHDNRAIRSALRFVTDFRPHHFIFGGDNHNISFLSRHNVGKPRLVEGFSAAREYQESDEHMIAPVERALPRGCVKHWMKGNHEMWVDLFLDQNPTIEGLIEPHIHLRLEERGWKIYDYGEFLRLGHLHFIHGDTVRSAAIYRANRVLADYGRSVVSGHAHTHQVHVAKAMSDQHPNIGVIAPMLGSLEAGYLQNAPTNWAQGFVYGYILPNGNFNVYTPLMINHKFAAEGKIYKP